MRNNNETLGDLFENVLANIKVQERSSPINTPPYHERTVPHERIIPQNPNIVREDGSQTITNVYHVVVNMGTQEQNQKQYPDSCGCNRGCDNGIVALNKISNGVATPKNTREKIIVGGLLAAMAYTGWQFTKFLMTKGVL